MKGVVSYDVLLINLGNVLGYDKVQLRFHILELDCEESIDPSQQAVWMLLQVVVICLKILPKELELVLVD